MRTYPADPRAVAADFPGALRAHLAWQAERFRAGRGRLVVARGRPGRGLDSDHLHTVPELFFQLGGETSFRLPGRRLRVPRGTLCLVPAGVPHEEWVVGDPAAFANVVLICLPTGLAIHLSLARTRSDGRSRPFGGQGWRIESEHDAALSARLLELERRGDETGAGTALVRDGDVLAVLGLLERILSRAEGPRALPARCQRVARHILHHLADPDLSVAALAFSVGCHPDHLGREFRQAHGVTVNRYLNERRIELARHLLVTTAERIGVIARRVGYRDPAYFARVFRRFEGLGPREYRLRG